MSFAYKDPVEKKIIVSVPVSESVEIPARAEVIYGETANVYAFFLACEKVKRVTFLPGNSLKTISDYAFYNCQNITDLDLTECKNLVSLGKNAFSKCYSLTTFHFPESKLKEINAYCFGKCTSLKSVHIPSTVNKVDEGAFVDCGMEEFYFEPNEKTNIGYWAFNGCNNLETLNIGKNIGSVTNTFNRDTSILKNIHVNNESTVFKSIDGVVYGINDNYLYAFPPGRTGHYDVLEGTTKIAFSAFMGTRLSTITLPQSLTVIESWVFGYSLLTKIEFPENLSELGSTTFGHSSLLENVTFPKYVKEIGSTCFLGCTSLKRVIMPDNFSTIGGGLFSGSAKDAEIIFSESSELKILD